VAHEVHRAVVLAQVGVVAVPGTLSSGTELPEVDGFGEHRDDAVDVLAVDGQRVALGELADPVARKERLDRIHQCSSRPFITSATSRSTFVPAKKSACAPAYRRAGFVNTNSSKSRSLIRPSSTSSYASPSTSPTSVTSQ